MNVTFWALLAVAGWASALLCAMLERAARREALELAQAAKQCLESQDDVIVGLVKENLRLKHELAQFREASLLTREP